MNKLVSIIIPTRNSSKYLDEVLMSIKKQTYENIEIILVDCDSTDNTKMIASKYTDKVIEFKKKGDHRSEQKNFGVKSAKGEYVVCLDSDAELTENIILECVELGENGVDMVIIPERHKGQGFWAKSKALERECYLGDDTIECPWFFSRETFLLVGGYNEEMLAGEDWDLFNKLRLKGYKHARCASFINHNIGRLRFFNYVNKKRYYGRNIVKFVNKNVGNSIKKIPFFRLAYLRNWKLLIKHPFLTIGFVLLKLGEMLGLIVGVVESRICKINKDYYDTK
jgi:glycosyltransferase involved in cell wall biosynthesis